MQLATFKELMEKLLSKKARFIESSNYLYSIYI